MATHVLNPTPKTSISNFFFFFCYQSAKQAARKWLSENPATWVLPKNPTDWKPRNKNFSQCCASRNQTLNQKNLPKLSLHVKPHVHELQHRDILVRNEVDQVTSGSKHMKHASASESTDQKRSFHELQKRCLHTTWQKRNTRRCCHMDSR